jgi:hypothetical protein
MLKPQRLSKKSWFYWLVNFCKALNPYHAISFKFHTWRTLNMLSLKYNTIEEKVANHIGKVFCVDHNNVQAYVLGTTHLLAMTKPSGGVCPIIMGEALY